MSSKASRAVHGWHASAAAAGCAMFLISPAFFALVTLGGIEAFETLRWMFGR